MQNVALLIIKAKKAGTDPLHAMEVLEGEEIWLLLIIDLGIRWS
jgi:hypothetical protein